jgi:hypothetical protein
LAAGGLSKSSLDLVEAIAMAAMLNLLGVPVPERLRVAYWGEDPADEIERRVAAILKHFKISREQIEGWLFVDSLVAESPLRAYVRVAHQCPGEAAACGPNRLACIFSSPFWSSSQSKKQTSRWTTAEEQNQQAAISQALSLDRKDEPKKSNSLV